MGFKYEIMAPTSRSAVHGFASTQIILRCTLERSLLCTQLATLRHRIVFGVCRAEQFCRILLVLLSYALCCVT